MDQNKDFYGDLKDDDYHSFDDYIDDDQVDNGADEYEGEEETTTTTTVPEEPPKERFVSNLEKLSKFKRLHREEVRKIRGKEKRLRRKRKKELGLPKQIPRTIENTRTPNDDQVDADDEEIQLDESLDEMSAYFSKQIPPKVLITSSHNSHRRTIRFCRELRDTIIGSELRWRKKCPLKKLVKCANERGYTDILVVNEDWSKPNALLHIHLPNGPTAYYRLSSIRYCKELKKRAAYNNSHPEIIVNNMTTRLGHTIGRMLASLFHFQPQFRGRKVITFHNQRDYIFFRHHLYEFKQNGQRVAISELGPRFTMKLQSLQLGTFDSKFGEYEWKLQRHEQGVNRRKFFL
ncbi:ribosome production factor 1 [Dermatophagoides pteronyssinus]|uniref:Ribosome production factor 1-like isoform X2 n=1 Tax=Dermatophagoides pteronyssinus TaxID=6956 RepID=A0A6P6XRN9_DERPT|nr:ribosome production factor 1-like isoform X2 [Dermatophagoides pteronyssinus]